MLNTITKLIWAGVIIGLSGPCAWGNRIDVIREDYPIYVVEGKDGIELPEDLSDPNNSDLWHEYDPLVEFIGIRLNFPEEIIQSCEDKYWKIRDENKIRELEEIVSTEKNFRVWCDKQEKQYGSWSLHSIYAYILKRINEKHYFIDWDFCSRVILGSVIESIYYKGATACMSGVYPHTPGGRYLKNFGFKW